MPHLREKNSSPLATPHHTEARTTTAQKDHQDHQDQHQDFGHFLFDEEQGGAALMSSIGEKCAWDNILKRESAAHEERKKKKRPSTLGRKKEKKKGRTAMESRGNRKKKKHHPTNLRNVTNHTLDNRAFFSIFSIRVERDVKYTRIPLRHHHNIQTQSSQSFRRGGREFFFFAINPDGTFKTYERNKFSF